MATQRYAKSLRGRCYNSFLHGKTFQKHFRPQIAGASAFSVVVHILISQTPKTGVSF